MVFPSITHSWYNSLYSYYFLSLCWVIKAFFQLLYDFLMALLSDIFCRHTIFASFKIFFTLIVRLWNLSGRFFVCCFNFYEKFFFVSKLFRIIIFKFRFFVCWKCVCCLECCAWGCHWFHVWIKRFKFDEVLLWFKCLIIYLYSTKFNLFFYRNSEQQKKLII